MNRITFSPPKQRGLYPSTNYNKQPSNQRDTYLVKKRMDFEKENYDTSNNSRKLSIKRYGYKKMKDITPVLQAKKEISHTKKISLHSLPFDVHLVLASYLQPTDILNSLQYVNKYWNQLCNDKRLWKKIHAIQALPIAFKYAKKTCIVERRSKGMVFKATSRLSGEQVIFLSSIYLSLKIIICVAYYKESQYWKSKRRPR